MEPSFLVCACELSRPTDQMPDSITFPGSTEGPPDMRQHTGTGGVTGLTRERAKEREFLGSGDRSGPDPGPSTDLDPNAQSGTVVPGYPSPHDARPTLHPGASFAGRTRGPLLPMQYVERGTLPGPSSLRHRASWVADGHWDTSSLAHGIQEEPTQVSHRATTHPDRFRRRRGGDEDQYEVGEAEDTETAPGARTPKRVRGEGGAVITPGYGEQQRDLYGTLHVTAVRVPDLEGDMGIWFLFTDICVRQEGT